MMMKQTMTNLTIKNSEDNLPDFVHIFQVENFQKQKPKLLQSISDMIITNDINLNEKGYYYDYNLPRAPRTYLELFIESIQPSVNQIEELYGLNCNSLGNPWFQQYEQGSDFGWHQHGSHFAIILYVELPEMTESTEFLNYGQFNVREGDIIFFPTFLVHRSPEIISNQRKTIIATNLGFEVDRDLIQLHGEEHFRH